MWVNACHIYDKACPKYMRNSSKLSLKLIHKFFAGKPEHIIKENKKRRMVPATKAGAYKKNAKNIRSNRNPCNVCIVVLGLKGRVEVFRKNGNSRLEGVGSLL